MATVIRTTLATILPYVRQQAMMALNLGTEAVVYGTPGSALRKPSLQADVVCLIRPRSQMTERNIVGGAGRIDARVVRKVTVVLWVRYDVDVDQQKERWLLDQDLGHLPKEHSLFNVFLTFHPSDPSGNWLLFEPIRLGPVSDPVEDTQQTEAGGWGYSGIDLELPFILDVDQGYQ